jgi:uncharacterized protein with HEPN domain
MRREELYLADIVDAADSIARALRGRSFDDFLAAAEVRDSVLYRLIVIGEAVAQLPSDVKDRHPEVPWRVVKDFRNRVVHGYFSMSWTIVWNTVMEAVPLLRTQVARILEEDYPPSEPSAGSGAPDS